MPDMLRSIADLKQYDEAQEQLQSHTLGSAGAAGTSMIFHGQGAIADKATYKADVRGYVNIVCKRLERYLDGQTAPLVVAAVEYEQSFYRQVNSYHNLLEEGIAGNPEGLDDKDIPVAASLRSAATKKVRRLALCPASFR